jgi:hypothetical protein
MSRETEGTSRRVLIILDMAKPFVPTALRSKVCAAHDHASAVELQ